MTTHFVFTLSGEGLLRDALRKSGRNDAVVSYADDLGFGPIDPPDPEVRAAWVQHNLGVSPNDWQRRTADIDAFWKTALTTPDRRVVWMTRRTVAEYTAFLEWVQRLGDAPYEVVDLTATQTTFRDRQGREARRDVMSLALLHPDQIQMGAFWNCAEMYSRESRDSSRAVWRRLRAENAPLRILTIDGLMSAPLNHYDRMLLSFATSEWKWAARIVGEGLAATFDDSFIQVGDQVLFARVRALVGAGIFESKGDLAEMRRCEVRLPAP